MELFCKPFFQKGEEKLTLLGTAKEVFLCRKNLRIEGKVSLSDGELDVMAVNVEERRTKDRDIIDRNQ